MTNPKKHFGRIITRLVENCLKKIIVKRLVHSEKFQKTQTAVNWRMLLNTADMISHYYLRLWKISKNILVESSHEWGNISRKNFISKLDFVTTNVTRMWLLADLLNATGDMVRTTLKIDKSQKTFFVTHCKQNWKFCENDTL